MPVGAGRRARMTRAHFVMIVAVVVSLSLLLTPSPAAACTCEMKMSIEHARRADVVFAGRLVEVDAGVRGPLVSSMDPISYRFDVDRVFKGAVPQNATVVSVVGGASCGLEHMNVGERYTIFARIDADVLRSGLCDGTHPGDPDPAVAVMSGLVLPPVAGAVPGWVFVVAALAVVLFIAVTREMVRRRTQGTGNSP